MGEPFLKNSGGRSEDVFILQRRVTSSPSITGKTGLCRITFSSEHRERWKYVFESATREFDQYRINITKTKIKKNR